MALPPVLLGLLHCGVRVLYECLRILSILGKYARADAGGEVQIVLVNGMRLGQRLRHSARGDRLVFGLSYCRERHHELVARWWLTVSEPRTQSTRRLATDCGSLSPVGWPSESLMCLRNTKKRCSSCSIWCTAS